ncbi:hypothetical protein PV10_05269 [Exophiala mesophila]|uniref:Uncharacterized protein n=1 Tax=Exophiala mesophila TaxID=212818 RepID=A0A0D1WXJ0_EXOME|nr:uncharacterized protein PV10_05269 [Exophiala mesophila]KIV94120.1 hypothetical protein PV10_05269 [Exophiala mesophila]
MTRKDTDKKRLKEKAQDLVRDRADVVVDPDETTGEDNFIYEKWPDVCGVVVDKGSENGFVQITGGGKPAQRINTGDGASGFAKIDIHNGQSCMLYGRPTVLYIRPRSS